MLTRRIHTQALKAAFTALMTCEAGKVQAAVASLVTRLKDQQSSRSRPPSASGAQSNVAGDAVTPPPPQGSLAAKEALALRLDQQYPGGDVGVLSAFFLNLVRKPGIGPGIN